jgi:hypothetical protein
MSLTLNIQDSTGSFKIKTATLNLLDFNAWMKITAVEIGFWDWTGNIFPGRTILMLDPAEWGNNIWVKREHAHCY